MRVLCSLLQVGTDKLYWRRITHFIPRGNVTRGDYEKFAYRDDDGGVHLSEQINSKVGLEIYL